METEALPSYLSGQFELAPKVKPSQPSSELESISLTVTILGCAGPVVELGRIVSLSTDHEFCHCTYTLEQLHELSGLRVEDVSTSLCSQVCQLRDWSVLGSVAQPVSSCISERHFLSSVFKFHFPSNVLYSQYIVYAREIQG